MVSPTALGPDFSLRPAVRAGGGLRRRGLLFCPGHVVSPTPGYGWRAPEEAAARSVAYSPEDRGTDTCCQPFRNPRTSFSL
jgi:hypothetical protein